MASLLERIQAVLTLCPEATGKIYLSETAHTKIDTADLKEAAAALSIDGTMLARANAELRSDKIKLRDDLNNAIADANAAAEERDALRAQVAEMTSGEPVAWLVDYRDGSSYAGTSKWRADNIARGRGLKLEPLFRATQPSPDVAELAAKVEALGIELADAQDLRKEAEDRAFSLDASLAAEKRMREQTRLDLVACQDKERAGIAALTQAMAGIDRLTGEKAALQARVDTLVAGERLTKEALAAAEKRATIAQGNYNHSSREREEFRDLCTSWRKRAEAAEDRVKVLEGSAKPVLWGRFFDDGAINTYLSEADARGFGNGGVVEPLYRHPPKPASASPLGWFTDHGNGYAFTKNTFPVEQPKGSIPVYAHPPKTGEPVASVGYVVQRRAQGGAWWNYNTLYSDLDDVDRFIKSSLGYWDRDEGRILEVVAVRSRMAIAGGKPNAFVEGKWTPLYEAPPPAAIGVPEGQFVATWKSSTKPNRRASSVEVFKSAADAEAQLPSGRGYESAVMRLVPIDAPTVDVAAIRATIDALTVTHPLAVRLRIAIGEKGG